MEVVVPLSQYDMILKYTADATKEYSHEWNDDNAQVKLYGNVWYRINNAIRSNIKHVRGKKIHGMKIGFVLAERYSSLRKSPELMSLV